MSLDRDQLLVTTVENVSQLPDVNINAGNEKRNCVFDVLLIHTFNTVHAQLRPHVQLQPHQQEGIEQMIYMEKAYRGGVLADDVSPIHSHTNITHQMV